MIRRLGKQGKAWLKTRREWIKQHPPNHQGYWQCALCPHWVHESEMQLDHIDPRSHAPHLRHEHDNLAPTHPACNTKKGSTH